jgi:tetratricopeptide (TPR) repeat protein
LEAREEAHQLQMAEARSHRHTATRAPQPSSVEKPSGSSVPTLIPAAKRSFLEDDFERAFDLAARKEYDQALSEYDKIMDVAESRNEDLLYLRGLDGKLFVTCRVLLREMNFLDRQLKRQANLTQIEKSFNRCVQLLREVESINDGYVSFIDLNGGLVDGADIRSGVDAGLSLIRLLMHESKESLALLSEKLDAWKESKRQEFEDFIMGIGRRVLKSSGQAIPSDKKKLFKKGYAEFKTFGQKTEDGEICLSEKSEERQRIDQLAKKMKKLIRLNEELSAPIADIVDAKRDLQVPVFTNGKVSRLVILQTIRAIQNGKRTDFEAVSKMLIKLTPDVLEDDQQEAEIYLMKQLVKDDAKDFIDLLRQYNLTNKLFDIKTFVRLQNQNLTDFVQWKLSKSLFCEKTLHSFKSVHFDPSVSKRKQFGYLDVDCKGEGESKRLSLEALDLADSGYKLLG